MKWPTLCDVLMKTYEDFKWMTASMEKKDSYSCTLLSTKTLMFFFCNFNILFVLRSRVAINSINFT